MGLTLSEIQKAVYGWSVVQFPRNTPLEPLEGIFEEAGELAHARVKRRQGIRHTPEQCVAMERDAIGDMGIYLCDFVGRAGLCVDMFEERAAMRVAIHRNGRLSSDRSFGLLASRVGHLVNSYNASCLHTNDVGDVLGCLIYYAEVRGWDFLEILNETWARVGKRDWRSDPVAAGESS